MDSLIASLSPFAFAALVTAVILWRRRRVEVVRSWEIGLLYRDSAFERELKPGIHTFYTPAIRKAVVRLPAVEQAGITNALEVSSRDGFAFRLHLGYRWTIIDGPGYHQASAGRAMQSAAVTLPGFGEALAAAAMAAAAARTLAETQAEPAAIAATVLAAVAPGFPTITVNALQVTQLQLPPETRRLMSEVEASRLRGLAALERARGEQAALRSLANAARLVRDNPELAQLRLLQAIETARKAPTLVIGQPAFTPAPVAPAGE